MFYDWFHSRDDESLVKGKRKTIRYKRPPAISLAQTGCHSPERLSSNSSLFILSEQENVRNPLELFDDQEEYNSTLYRSSEWKKWKFPFGFRQTYNYL
jgi:hypothetical protein